MSTSVVFANYYPKFMPKILPNKFNTGVKTRLNKPVYYDLLISGNGSIAGKTLAIEFYQNVLKAPHPFIVPGGVTLSSPATNDTEGSLDEFAQRLFIEISSKGAGDYFNLSRVTLVAAADNWAPLRGV